MHITHKMINDTMIEVIHNIASSDRLAIHAFNNACSTGLFGKKWAVEVQERRKTAEKLKTFRHTDVQQPN